MCGAPGRNGDTLHVLMQVSGQPVTSFHASTLRTNDGAEGLEVGEELFPQLPFLTPTRCFHY